MGCEKVPMCQGIREGLLIEDNIQTQSWNYKNSSGEGGGAVLEEECFRQRGDYHVGKFGDEQELSMLEDWKKFSIARS